VWATAPSTSKGVSMMFLCVLIAFGCGLFFGYAVLRGLGWLGLVVLATLTAQGDMLITVNNHVPQTVYTWSEPTGGLSMTTAGNSTHQVNFSWSQAVPGESYYGSINGVGANPKYLLGTCPANPNPQTFDFYGGAPPSNHYWLSLCVTNSSGYPKQYYYGFQGPTTNVWRTSPPVPAGTYFCFSVSADQPITGAIYDAPIGSTPSGDTGGMTGDGGSSPITNGTAIVSGSGWTNTVPGTGGTSSGGSGSSTAGTWVSSNSVPGLGWGRTNAITGNQFGLCVSLIFCQSGFCVSFTAAQTNAPPMLM